MKVSRLLLCVAMATCWAGIALAEDLVAVAKPEELGFAPDRLKRITEAYQGYVERGELPGAVLPAGCGWASARRARSGSCT